MPFMNLAELFDWECEDTLNIYPFQVRCIAADFHPEVFGELLELGKPVIDLIYSRSNHVPRQVKYGQVCLYFPERWLSPKEKIYLMNSLADLHTTYPLQYVHIITGEPVIISDMVSDMVRKLVLDKN
jgi:hypothetical protein